MRPRRLVYASFLAAGLTLAFASAAFADVDISVDKTTQHMIVSVDGATRYVWPVSTGRPDYNTPNGVFHPLWMSVLHHSKIYDDAPTPDSIFFTGGYAIHGFTDTPFGVAAVSHGCVRLPRRDAAALFRLVKRDGMANTTIVIHGHIPPGGWCATLRTSSVRRVRTISRSNSMDDRRLTIARLTTTPGRPQRDSRRCSTPPELTITDQDRTIRSHTAISALLFGLTAFLSKDQ
jgi:L,D-transpeptidase catalytic domain